MIYFKNYLVYTFHITYFSAQFKYVIRVQDLLGRPMNYKEKSTFTTGIFNGNLWSITLEHLQFSKCCIKLLGQQW